MSDTYSNRNLRGKSFKGKDLSFANFSDSDIRGTDFTNAFLVNANFSNARTGLRAHWLALLIFISFLLTGLSGLIAGYVGAFPVFISRLLLENFLLEKMTVIGLGVLCLMTFCIVIVRNGIGTALGVVTVTVSASTAIIAFLGEDSSEIIAAALIQSIIIAITVAGILIGALAVNLVNLITERKLFVPISVVSILAAIVGALESIGDLEFQNLTFALIISFLITVFLIIISAYLGLQATLRNKKYSLIYTLNINLCSMGGTSFRGANLTDATFVDSSLKFTDFRYANLTRTCWLNSSYLSQCRSERTYLEISAIRELVTTHNGQNKDFDHMDLRGINLQNANLSNINLIGTNLSEANLQSADLSRAKLVKSQLYGTDLRKACLTGACIQDWAIATDTKLDKVQCKYVYMRLPTPDNPEVWRKPDNREEVFKENDFTDFIAPIVKTLDLYKKQNLDPRQVVDTFRTLDLYHYKGIDPSASAIAIKQLAEQYPEARLELVALEGRGREKIRLQAVISDAVNPSKLNSSYFERYREISSLPYQNIQALLLGMAEKDERIRSLEQMVNSAIQSQRYYVETYYNVGDTVSEKSSSINIQAGGDIGNVSGIVGGDVSGVLNLGTISGNVTNAINQLPDSGESDQGSLKDLLQQLKIAIESEIELSPEDKAEALEQVGTLAETGQNPEDSTLKKAGKTAIKILKGTVSGLSETNKLVQECTTLIPAISALLLLV